MNPNPIYEALVTELKFNPAAIQPTPTRLERKREHTIWAQAAWKRAHSAKPAKKRARKVAGA